MESRNLELRPGYKKTKNSTVTGKRLFNTTSLIKTEAGPEDTYYVRMPILSANQVIVPDMMNLTFKFNNSNTKSRFKNNLGRILCEGLTIQIGGEIVYDNRGEGVFETYKDLWKTIRRETECWNTVSPTKIFESSCRRRQRDDVWKGQ